MIRNPKKEKFLAGIPRSCIDGSDIGSRCKFNFSFFDPSQPAGQDFNGWNQAAGLRSLAGLLDKLKNYTAEPLVYWKNQRVGAGGLKVLEQYGSFPKHSDFKHPPHVPHDVIWSRFRIGQKVRLVGFVLPEGFNGQETSCQKYRYDSNTFYVVFLDADHLFYKTEAD